MKEAPKEFLRFAKASPQTTIMEGDNCVIYTRVSTKEQADSNLSLHTQKKNCELFCERLSYKVIAYFGGTYESAQNDERKEFKKMLDFVKKSKQKISYIIVYSMDRFSRSGANAIYIASKLRESGIRVVSVTQPTDTLTPSGNLQQNIHFIFSEYDNQIRREKTMAGTRERLMLGYWTAQPPLGYDNVKINGEQKLVVNEKGKLLKKAFEWKAKDGLSNVEIRDKLKALGLPLQKQMITKIFFNPFYCGLITHKTLNGKIVEGRHEKLVSHELFLKVNRIQKEKRIGWKCFDENNSLPLKKIMTCEKCGYPMRGYIVKKKNIHYYKCGTIGCNVNENAERLNELMLNYLSYYKVNKGFVDVMKYQLEATFMEAESSNKEAIALLEKELVEQKQKVERLEERFINEEISKELFDKYNRRNLDEIYQNEMKLQMLDLKVSNLSKDIDASLNIATNMDHIWLTSDYNTKQSLVKMVFPEGISYDKENKQCRTKRVNSVLLLINRLSQAIEKKNKGLINLKVDESLLAEREGFEPPDL